MARLAFEAECQVLDRVAQHREAARLSPANRRRKDLDDLRAFIDDMRDRLPAGMRAVGVHCIEHGYSIQDTAERLGIEPTTVRTQRRRIRAIVRRNQRARRQ